MQALVELLGVATLAQVALYVRGFLQSSLIKRGAGVATSRVVAEGAQIVGAAAEFMVRATPAQKRLLATVTPSFLSAAASGLHLASQLEAKVSRRRAKGLVRRKVAKGTVSELVPTVRARRELFCAHLVAMASGDAGWIARIQGACGAAPDGDALAASIEAMVAEGRALATHVRSQGAEVTVDEGYLTEMSELAATVRAASSETFGVPADSSAQAELDWWDGVNLWFLSALVDNFAKARKLDKTVPKLSVGAVTNVIKQAGPRSRKRAQKTPAPKKPA